MNKKFWLFALVLLSIGLIFTQCKKDDKNNNTTSTPATVTDIDGNLYHTVTIGSQVWLVENLKTTKYRNGDPIPNFSASTQWAGASTGAYCDYDNDTNNAAIYGHLYNWHAVNDSRNIAPTGWHVATDSEWVAMVNYLGGDSVAGGKMKEAGTTHWQSPNTGATNSSGLTALPGGYRWVSGTFAKIGYFGRWWCSTTYDNYNANDFILNNDDAVGSKGYNLKGVGYSVRCVRD